MNITSEAWQAVNTRPINPGATIELNVSSDPSQLASVRKAMEAMAERAGFDEHAVGEIGLCVNEALANIIRHAYSGKTDRPINISASVRDDQMQIALRDWGCGVDPSTLPCRPYDPLEPGGVGLICLHQWMDDVSYTPQPDGMLTVLRRKKALAGQK